MSGSFSPASSPARNLLGYLLRPVGQDIGNYRYTPFVSDAYGGLWSPDGKAVAYSSVVNGVRQIFLRYLNSPNPVQLTHEKRETSLMGWSSDRSHLIVIAGWSPLFKLYAVATVGGELEFIMTTNCIPACNVSHDGKVFATFIKGTDNSYNIEVSDPLGSALRPYKPAPFASKDYFNSPYLDFSPDGKKILLFRAGRRRSDSS